MRRIPALHTRTTTKMNQAAASASNDRDGYPPRAYAWFVVALLTLAYAISLLDRWILSLLVGPVKAYFGVSDTQMGLLMGFWFAVFYVTMGLPFGWIADRFNRRTLIGVAMVFWCTMTIGCGLARTFGQLAAARLGIGLGEAALTPAANSLIADYFPRSEQNRAISFFNMGISMGMGIAYLVGGLIVAWMATQPPFVLPVVGKLETWQVVFIAAGAPGLLVAALVFTIREPLRRQRLAREGEKITLGQCLDYMRTHRAAYQPLLIGMIASPLIGYAWNWMPTMFERVYGWNVAQFSGVYGWILLVFGPLGAISGGIIATRLYKAGNKSGPYVAALIGLAVMTLTSGLLPLAPTPELAAAMLVPATWAGALSSAAGAAAVVFMTPGEFRAQVTSIYVLTINGVGLLVGPTAIGWLNDHVFTEPTGVRYSLATLVLVAASALTLYLSTGRRAYFRSVEELERHA